MVWKPYKVSWLSYWWATFPLVNINKTPGVEEVGENWAGSPGSWLWLRVSDVRWQRLPGPDWARLGQTGPDGSSLSLSTSQSAPAPGCSRAVRTEESPGLDQLWPDSLTAHTSLRTWQKFKNQKKKGKSFKRKKETWRVKTISVSRPGGQQLVNSNI